MSDLNTVIRTVTELDQVRLFSLLRRQFGAAPSPLSEALTDVVDNADVVTPQEVGADIVTMGSRLAIVDGASGMRRELTLAYPEDVDVAAGCISILSPIGTALLGLRVGDEAQWRGADGKSASARVDAIVFQPEASGDFTG